MTRQEKVDVLDNDGNPTGEIVTLTGSNLAGYWHAGVHVGLYTKDRRVLLQQRSRSIMMHPGLWDLGMGGVVAAGERVETAAKREVFEELGVIPQDLRLIARWRYNHHLPNYGMHTRIFVHAFIAEIDPANLSLQAAEVRDVRLLPLAEAHDALFMHKGLPQVHLEPYAGSYRQILSAIEAHFGHSNS